MASTLAAGVGTESASQPRTSRNKKGGVAKSERTVPPFMFISERENLVPEDGCFNGTQFFADLNPYTLSHAGDTFSPFIGKRVGVTAKTKVYCYELGSEDVRSHVDIVRLFGGEEKIATSIFDLHSVLCRENPKKAGDLIAAADFEAPLQNYFYMINGTGIRPVVVEKDVRGWRVFCLSMYGRGSRLIMTEGRCRIFTRVPILKHLVLKNAS